MREIKSFIEVMAGDIGFYMGDGKLSDAIQAFTYSKALKELGYETPSHTFMFISPDKVVEAVNKTRITSSYFYKKEFEAGRVKILRPSETYLDVSKGCIEAFSNNFENYPYGWLQILGFLPVLAFRKIGIKFPNLFPFFNICSEDTLIYLRIIYDYFVKRVKEYPNEHKLYTAEIERLKWVKKLNKETTDPALLMLYCLLDGQGVKKLLKKNTLTLEKTK